MKKITNDETLKAAVQELYEKTRTAMIERAGQWGYLEITFAHVCKIAKINGLKVEPLPIPKSIVQGAPQIVTEAAKKAKATTPPPPPAGDVLADNAKKTSERSSKIKNA